MNPKTKRILIIDDEADFRFWLADVLTVAGYEVLSAANGKDALGILRQGPVDLVITDMLMPKMDGVETILALQRHAPNVKIVAVSGGGHMPSDKLLKVAETLGVNKTISKPFGAPEILDVVRGLLENGETEGL